jgi:hypothetical protein
MTSQKTIRQLLEPLFGRDALARAEATTYRLHESRVIFCDEDERCALGEMALDYPYWSTPYGPTNFPYAEYIRTVDGRPSPLVVKAARVVTLHNDSGQLAEPGTLTALLDTPLVP